MTTTRIELLDRGVLEHSTNGALPDGSHETYVAETTAYFAYPRSTFKAIPRGVVITLNAFKDVIARPPAMSAVKGGLR